MKVLLEKLAQRQDLTAEEMVVIMDTIALGAADPIQIGVFLSLLRSKGETPVEVQSLVSVMLRHARLVPLQQDVKTLDIVGTGGDGANTVNLSTSAAILAAACGAKVAKHGNRSVSSRSGSADVLEVMGVPMLEPQHISPCINEANIAFMYAPHFHPAMKHVAPVRKSMGIRSVFNVLGPLINPAKCQTSVIGVYTPSLLDLFGQVLHLMGVEHALVVHCAGLDELNPIGDAEIVEVTQQGCQRYTLTPEEIGIPRCTLKDLEGGDADENCRILRQVFQGGEHCENAIGNTIAYNAGAGRFPVRAAPRLTVSCRRVVCVRVGQHNQAWLRSGEGCAESWRGSEDAGPLERSSDAVACLATCCRPIMLS
ncbi:anthranilate phosphoribosyltransferase, variant 1 [Aphanomyces invadans]|uniref:anthranilate phosphoribosyltransferase n=1 Tax=Aphanomyces invadans TaxID=157072 RepID=A0A024UF81_9STRA|nr:anthranilate phosphoribosyltransferase, variant 1 [Aphanomyces invadans]ETW04298.1 anthranilate phosphoribosyltransferase, variant 1 [Aphanomyces invadans]|eukprot:XP_008867254.1 anthranilate phosphoribosyltransferase, variant 1 [Aphanomyces invadans]